MGMVKRRMKVSNAMNLHAMCGKSKGKGSMSLHDVTRVRKALEGLKTETMIPLFYREKDTDRTWFGGDLNKPLFICSECEKGIVAYDKETKEIQPCSGCGADFKDDDGKCDFEPDWELLNGFKTMKLDGKLVRHGILEIPRRFISGTIWTKILQPFLEGEHTMEGQDVAESICNDFEEDGLPKQFENLTVKVESDEEEEKKADAEDATKTAPKLVGDEAAKKEEEKVLAEGGVTKADKDAELMEKASS